MIVLLFSVMAGLATLARGLLFTAAVCLALVTSVSVLHASLRIGGMLGGPAWIAGVLAILAFVLVVGGPTYLLAIREDSPPVTGSAPDGRPADDTADDRPTDDGSDTDPVPAADEGAPTEHGAPDDPDGGDQTEDAVTDDEGGDGPDDEGSPGVSGG